MKKDKEKKQSIINERKKIEDDFKKSNINFEYRIIKKNGTYKKSTIKSKKSILVPMFDI